MIAAAAWPDEQVDARLLHVDPVADRFVDRRVSDLPRLLGRGDLLVLNDAATLPASLRVDANLEIRLCAEVADGRWRAALFGAGDWRTRTEHRPPPRTVQPGDRLVIRASGSENGADVVGDLVAHVEEVEAARLVTLRFDRSGADLWSALYRLGRPVQYSYLREPLTLAMVQTAYATRPWAVEMPSAGRALGWQRLSTLRERGVAIATLTHAAGLSSTGDPDIDARLPLPERYEIPCATVDAIAGASRVIAVGTTVVRALEGSAKAHGHVVAGQGVTDLVVGPAYSPLVVDGVLSGVHDPGSSHFALLAAFAPVSLLNRAMAHAERAGYQQHEFGDSTLIATLDRTL